MSKLILGYLLINKNFESNGDALQIQLDKYLDSQIKIYIQSLGEYRPYHLGTYLIKANQNFIGLGYEKIEIDRLSSIQILLKTQEHALIHKIEENSNVESSNKLFYLISVNGESSFSLKFIINTIL